MALDFLQKNREKRFALFLSFNPPHPPYELVPEKYVRLYEGLREDGRGLLSGKSSAWAPHPEGAGDPVPEGFDRRTAVRQYCGAITGIDENIGRIVSWLKENRLYEDTCLMISADHGDMMGDHQLISKHIWYEGSVGIPLLICGGRIRPMRTKELVAGEDQAATILGLLGIPVPACMDGMDFSPLLRGEPFSGHRSVLTMAFPNTGERIREYEAHGLNFMDFGWRCVVTERYKLAVNRGQQYGMEPQTYLYDLEKDPGENRPIDDPEVMEFMRSELRYWCRKNRDFFMEVRK